MLRRMTYIALALSRWSARPTIAMPLGARAFRPPSSSAAAAAGSALERHRRDGTAGPAPPDRPPSSAAPAGRRGDGGSSLCAAAGGCSDGGPAGDDVPSAAAAAAATATTTTTTAAATAARRGGGPTSIDRGREKRKEFIGLAKAVDRGQFQNAYSPGGPDGASFAARSGLPSDGRLFCVLGIESSCDDTGGEAYLVPEILRILYSRTGGSERKNAGISHGHCIPRGGRRE